MSFAKLPQSPEAVLSCAYLCLFSVKMTNISVLMGGKLGQSQRCEDNIWPEFIKASDG